MVSTVSPERLFQAAVAASESGNIAEAVQLYGKALRFGDHRAAWYNLGSTALNNLLQAIASVRRGELEECDGQIDIAGAALTELMRASVKRAPHLANPPLLPVVALRDAEGWDNQFDLINKISARARMSYDEDRLRLWDKTPHYLSNEKYRKARADSGATMPIQWRHHTCTWAAFHALKLPGDFVECGVWQGETSDVICRYVDINATGKAFYLFDTYQGIPTEQMTESEREGGARNIEFIGTHDIYEAVKQRFSGFPNVHLVRGKVPESLSDVDIEQVSFLHIDMNVAYPEIAAIRHFWGKMPPGGVVILDDYGWDMRSEQREGMDEFAESQGVEICALPTGQGLILHP